MKKNTFQKSLIATARITCCASLLGIGCDKKNPSAAEPTSTLPEATEASTALPQKQETRITTNTETPRTYNDECKQLIKQTYPNQETWYQPEEVSQEVKDCCQLAAEYYDQLQQEGNWTESSNWKERDQCCGSALDWTDQTISCTPWGPPMPPKFRASKISRPQNVPRILVSFA